MKLSDACDAYLNDLKRRNLASSTIDNYRSLFRSWIAFGRQRKLTNLCDFNQTVLLNFHDTWRVQPSSARTRHNMLRTFFSFAVDMNWIDHSPMAKLKPPKVTQIPTPAS